jgi:hypothetical protein
MGSDKVVHRTRFASEASTVMSDKERITHAAHSLHGRPFHFLERTGGESNPAHTMRPTAAPRIESARP